MVIAIQENYSAKLMTISMDELIKKWASLKENVSEANLNAQFTNWLLDFLAFSYDVTPTIGGGLRPDYVLYDISGKPLLYIETKTRNPNIARSRPENFLDECKINSLYTSAVYGNGGTAGIKQYLTTKNAAKYGMVFNGDFWQLFRRIDGLVLPLTDILRVTQESLPKLVEQLQSYLRNPDRAFTVSLWNRKGGVGKTTNIINIAAVLARANKRVLVVDIDPQSDLTRGLGIEPSQYKNKILGCFDQIGLGNKDKALELLDELITRQQFHVPTEKSSFQIDVIPTERETLEHFRNEEYTIKNKQTLLKRLLSLIVDRYDYIFIDTSPDPDILTASSFFAADGLLIPADYDQRALHHARDISQGYTPKIRSHRGDIHPRLLGVVFSNHVDMGKKMDDAVKAFLEKSSLKVYDTKLGIYAVVRQASFKQQPVISVSPKAQISKDYQKLVDEIFLTPNFIY